MREFLRSAGTRASFILPHIFEATLGILQTSLLRRYLGCITPLAVLVIIRLEEGFVVVVVSILVPGLLVLTNLEVDKTRFSWYSRGRRGELF